MRRRLLWYGLMTLSTTACGAGWRQPAQLTPGPWPARRQVQIWVGPEMARWHGVVIRSDSISGVPFLEPPDCDSCRRVLPLARVDSVRVGNPEAGFWKTLGLVVGIPVLAFAIICSDETGGPPCSD
jgi:hypothetical protein